MAGESAVRRATALVTVVMCLVAVSEAGYGAANGGLGEVPLVAALVVLPLLYVVPATSRCGCDTGTCCLPFRRR